jgi:4-carboxymuconolactone decarboxylase
MTPRIQPVSLADAEPETRELLGALSTLRGDDAEVLNVFRTMAQHPKLMKRWLVFANHVLTKSTLSGRDRELAILRSGWRCNAPYEWGQHVVIGQREGIRADEIERIAAGPDAPGWSTHDAAILRATDELHDTSTISDATWATLAETYDQQQMMDLVFAIGQYHLVSFALNAFGVERDDGLDDSNVPFPPPAHASPA